MGIRRENYIGVIDEQNRNYFVQLVSTPIEVGAYRVKVQAPMKVGVKYLLTIII